MSASLEQKVRLLAVSVGAVTGVLTEVISEMAKVLKGYAGSDFDKCLDQLEAKAIRTIENAAFEGVPEKEQLFLIEQTTATIRSIFSDIRKTKYQ